MLWSLHHLTLAFFTIGAQFNIWSANRLTFHYRVCTHASGCPISFPSFSCRGLSNILLMSPISLGYAWKISATIEKFLIHLLSSVFFDALQYITNLAAGGSSQQQGRGAHTELLHSIGPDWTEFSDELWTPGGLSDPQRLLFLHK